jgi:DNA-binding NarL/FixJ family response regulator
VSTNSGQLLHSVLKPEVAPHRPSVEPMASAIPSEGTTVVVVETRAFIRDCIVRALKSTLAFNVLAFSAVREWSEFINTVTDVSGVIIVVCVGGLDRNAATKSGMAQVILSANRFPTIIISDDDNGEHIVEALELGVKAYIPTNTPLDITIEAIRMVKAGGTFVPAASLIASQKLSTSQNRQTPPLEIFTPRQTNVIEALRRGKSNKVIAYELNMCESTVKVHVRNIMKRLHAKNRTQVAIMANEALQQTDQPPLSDPSGMLVHGTSIG